MKIEKLYSFNTDKKKTIHVGAYNLPPFTFDSGDSV